MTEEKNVHILTKFHVLTFQFWTKDRSIYLRKQKDIRVHISMMLHLMDWTIFFAVKFVHWNQWTRIANIRRGWCSTVVFFYKRINKKYKRWQQISLQIRLYYTEAAIILLGVVISNDLFCNAGCITGWNELLAFVLRHLTPRTLRGHSALSYYSRSWQNRGCHLCGENSDPCLLSNSITTLLLWIRDHEIPIISSRNLYHIYL